MRIRLGLVFALAALLAGCQGPCSKIESINAPALDAGGVDLSTYVAVGTSLSAGYESGGVVDRHQVHSFPALFARQIGKTVQTDGQGTFTMPTINFDGIPALLEIKSLSPLIVNNAGRTTGAPTNLAQNFAYHDMGIPGAVLLDLIDTTHYHTTAPPVFRTNFTYFNIIQRTRGTVLAQALSLAPTLISLEYGANEILGPTTQLGIQPSAATGVSFALLLTASLNAIHATLPNTKVAVFNVPDVTTIPYFTTFPAFTVSTVTGQPVPLEGVDGPLQLGDLILLPASALIATGTGIPAGGYNYLNPAAGSNGLKLPESLILRAAEVVATQTEIAKMNDAVDSAATRPFVAKVDIHDFLAGIAADGIRVGGNLYTSDYITGGIFSLDGVHPNDLGYALMANQLIDGVNARFGSRIPRVNPSQEASPNASRVRPFKAGPAYPTDLQGLRESLDMIYPH
jgi:lysophospholipase L1-like esterase